MDSLTTIRLFQGDTTTPAVVANSVDALKDGKRSAHFAFDTLNTAKKDKYKLKIQTDNRWFDTGKTIELKAK